MLSKNDELLKRLLATFRVEADEHLGAMSAGLIALEKASSDTESAGIIETIFREAHSLKGAARAVNLTLVESLCQALESVFAMLKKQQIAVSLPLLDLLHKTINGLGALLAANAENGTGRRPAVDSLIRQLEQAASGALPAGAKAAEAPVPDEPPLTAAYAAAAPGTVRIATNKLDAVMQQVEELLSPRLAARQREQELQETAAMLAGWKKARAQIQPLLRQIERATAAGETLGTPAGLQKNLRKVIEYLDDERRHLAKIEERLARLNKSAAHDQRTLGTMADSLLHDVKEMQLLPFSSMTDIFPRMIRELARDQGKEAGLSIQGGEIEIDRRILDELKDPFLHLLRNAIDHGIETPEKRQTQKKPLRGTITIEILQHDAGKVDILIADDGAGIDSERVKAAAGRQGRPLPQNAEEADEREILSLIFQSGISTSSIITDVSGRGLGLAIVREKVERLGGSISVESQAGAGTAFRITLPLSIANLRGVLVRAGDQLCAIPSAGVERVARIARDSIRTVENRETIMLNGRVVPLVTLHEMLEMPHASDDGTEPYAPVVVLGLDEDRVAFRVGEILGEQHILVKSLGPQLARVRNVAGACVLGNGRLVPVLNVVDLLKSAAGAPARPAAPRPESRLDAGAARAVLVAEDSITSRSLLKSILESAGYAVTTAVDGLDAYTTLKTGTFDLVVSDVEMPRMDGFDLTAKIRADRQLAELPVILVTALGSREHRERGIDAGANAYIVKSSFDQSNLLETIRRLI